MRRVYTELVGYSPSSNQITYYKAIPFEVAVDDNLVETEIFNAFKEADTVKNIILGRTVRGDIYQLSIPEYGTYIRENRKTVDGFINKSRFLCTLTKFKIDRRIPLN